MIEQHSTPLVTHSTSNPISPRLSNTAAALTLLAMFAVIVGTYLTYTAGYERGARETRATYQEIERRHPWVTQRYFNH